MDIKNSLKNKKIEKVVITKDINDYILNFHYTHNTEYGIEGGSVGRFEFFFDYNGKDKTVDEIKDILNQELQIDKNIIFFKG